jgi:hypothetical protein
MSPGATVVVDVNEDQGQERPRAALAAFTLPAEPGSLTHERTLAGHADIPPYSEG